jgi:ion channel POLLUX/CASTOR
MKKYTFSEKLRYRFDNLMSKGPAAMIMLLGLLSLFVVIIAGTLFWGFKVAPEGESELGFIEGVWVSLMRTLDPGTMGGDAGWSFRIIAFSVTLGGIFIISTLIGVLSSGIQDKLESLRKGRSVVIEKNHTLILGWSSKVFTIVSELIVANENQRKPRVVILADHDKVEMEDELRDKIDNFKNTKVICRKGRPNDLTDLEIANPRESRSIIVLASENENADPQTIKTILAITNNPNRRSEPYHIVAEIKDEKNLEVAKMVGKDEVELILSDDVIARIMVQTSRQSGLSIVYTELMDFDGDEMYFQEEKGLIGKTFAESLFAYRDSCVLGLQFADGSTKVNPPMDYVIQEGEKVIAITEDDDTLVLADSINYKIDEDAICTNTSIESGKESILMLGWNSRAETIIGEMDNYLAKGSSMKVVSSYEIVAKSLNLHQEH